MLYVFFSQTGEVGFGKEEDVGSQTRLHGKCGHKPESACSDINKSYSINGVALDGTLKALEIIGSPASIPLLEPVVPNPNGGGAAGI
jgi:hypothetical protein